MYTRPTQVPGTYQSRPDSAPNKSYNCGPSSITHIARYYKDRNFGINDTRRLGTSSNGRGTTPAERALMLTRRGVQCTDDRNGPQKVIAVVRSGKPVSASFKMSMIPYPYRRYSFTGLHEMVVVAVGPGIKPEAWIMDPNYGWPDGKTGYLPMSIKMPYSVWADAFTATGGWSIIPEHSKPNPTRRTYRKRCTTKVGLNVRSGPGTNFSRITTLPKGSRFTSTMLEANGGAYRGPDGRTRKDWLSYTRNGKVVWVARAYVNEA